MANDNTVGTTEMVSTVVGGVHLRLPILPEVGDDEQEVTLDELAGRDPHLEAILNANPVQSKEEILREACRDLVNSAYQNLLQNNGYEQFFREDYNRVEEEEWKYKSALQESSRNLKNTFKELRDNAEDAATKRIFEGYFRTAHLQLKNKTARAEHKEEQRLLNVLDANTEQREIIKEANETAEKAFYFNILFSDRVKEIVTESKEETASKVDLEKRLYSLADAMRPAGIKQETKSQYHEAARIAVETVGNELTEAQRKRTEAVSIALGREYTGVPAFERKYATKKTQPETTTDQGFYVSLSEESRATTFHNRMEAIATASKGKRRNELHEAFPMGPYELRDGKLRAVSKEEQLEWSFFKTLPRDIVSEYAEQPSVLDNKTDDVPDAVLEKRVRKSNVWNRVTGAIAATGIVTAAVAAFVASIGYFAQVSNEAYNIIYNSFAPQQEQVEVVGEAYKPAETIEQKVEVDAPKKARAKKQYASMPAQAATATYRPTEDQPMTLKKGSYTREDRTIELTPITVDYTSTIPDVEIKIEPRAADDIYRVFGMSIPQSDQGVASEQYKPKPQGARYDLGVEIPELPEYKPLDLRVDRKMGNSRDYSLGLPKQTAPNQLVLVRF